MKRRIVIFTSILCAATFLTACNNKSITITTTPGQYKHYKSMPKNNKDTPTKQSDKNNPIETTAYVPDLQDEYNSIIKLGAGKISDNILKSMDINFLKWVADKYDKNIFSKLHTSLIEGTYTDNIWYTTTGNTYHVLKDYYCGTLDSSEKARVNGIYLKESSAKDKISISFAGDLCLSEEWYTVNKYTSSGNQLNKCISQNLIDSVSSSDLFFLNNEFTFSNRGAPLNGKYYTFRTDPSRVNILKELGVDVVSLSNNHIYDFGPDALSDTLTTLRNSDIPYFGGGNNINEARKPVYFIINGIKIAFVGASRAEKIRYTPQASESSPGILLAYNDAEYLDVIKQAKKYSDYVIAYIHWGTEDSHTVTDYQKSMGHAFIDAGADIVVGGHPHVLQGIEYYNNKPILYSLGDFWFNNETKETGVINIDINSNGLMNTSFLPCMQKDLSTTLETDANETRRIYDFLQKMSFGISIDDNGKITPSN